MTPKEQKVFDMQCESTKALLLAQSLRSKDDDLIYIAGKRDTKIDFTAQCLKEDGSIDLNVRNLTQENADSYNALRRSRGRLIQDRRKEENRPTLTAETKEKAVDAFMRTFSMAALKDKFKSLMGSLFKPSYAERVADEIRKRRHED